MQRYNSENINNVVDEQYISPPKFSSQLQQIKVKFVIMDRE